MKVINKIIHEISNDTKPHALEVAKELGKQCVGNKVLMDDAATCLRDDCRYIQDIATRLKDVADREWGDGELIDWYINSVNGNDPPKWTEEHIRELLHDFHVIRKGADE